MQQIQANVFACMSQAKSATSTHGGRKCCITKGASAMVHMHVVIHVCRAHIRLPSTWQLFAMRFSLLIFESFKQHMGRCSVLMCTADALSTITLPSTCCQTTSVMLPQQQVCPPGQPDHQEWVAALHILQNQQAAFENRIHLMLIGLRHL